MWTAPILAFVVGFVGSMPLAGPIALLIVARATERRYGEARGIAFGASVAEAGYAGVAFFGFSNLFAARPGVAPIAKLVTAALLFGIGIRFVVWKPSKKGSANEGDPRRGLWRGFLISALNPTMLVTWSVVVAALFSHGLLSSARAGANPPTSVIATLPWSAAFGASAGAGVCAWFLVLVAILKKNERRFSPAALTWVVRAMGALLVGLGLWSVHTIVRDGLHVDARARTAEDVPSSSS